MVGATGPASSRAASGLILPVVLSAVACPAQLRAQDSTRPGWHGRVAPYLWLSAVEGGGRFRDVDEAEVPVGDGALHPGGAVRLKAWRGALVGIAEYARASAPTGRTAPGSGDLRISTVEVGGGVRVGRPPPESVVELLGGARYVRHARTALSAGEAPVVRPRKTAAWVEPFAGARFRSYLGAGFRFSVSGSIGGGGIGSEFTWEMDGELGVRLLGNAELLFRYRFRETEYDGGEGGYTWNGRTQGWLLGVGVAP